MRDRLFSPFPPVIAASTGCSEAKKRTILHGLLWAVYLVAAGIHWGDSRICFMWLPFAPLSYPHAATTKNRVVVDHSGCIQQPMILTAQPAPPAQPAQPAQQPNSQPNSPTQPRANNPTTSAIRLGVSPFVGWGVLSLCIREVDSISLSLHKKSGRSQSPEAVELFKQPSVRACILVPCCLPHLRDAPQCLSVPSPCQLIPSAGRNRRMKPLNLQARKFCSGGRTPRHPWGPLQ